MSEAYIFPESPLRDVRRLDEITYGGPQRQLQNILTQRSQRTILDETITNLLLWTDDLTKSQWIKTSTTITTNAEIGPDRVLKADRIEVDASGDKIEQTTASITSGTKVYFGIWLKGSGSVDIVLTNNGDASNISLTITDISEWNYYTINKTWAATGTATIKIESNDNKDILVFAPQIVQRANNFNMYIISVGTVGTYLLINRQDRFIMYEDIASPQATAMVESPISTTPIMMEDN